MGLHGTMQAMVACAIAVAAATAGSAMAKDRAAARADAWLGRDASDLLMELRVDGGRVDIVEDDATGETSYTWSTWNPAYRETVVTGGGLSYGAPNGGQIVGMTTASPGVASAPIYQAPTQTHYVDHDATHRCDVTFHADADGIITRWEYTGASCSSDIQKPRR